MGHASRLHLQLPLSVLRYLTSEQTSHDLKASIHYQQDADCQLSIRKDDGSLHIVLTALTSNDVLNLCDESYRCHVHEVAECCDADIKSESSDEGEESHETSTGGHLMQQTSSKHSLTDGLHSFTNSQESQELRHGNIHEDASDSEPCSISIKTNKNEKGLRHFATRHFKTKCEATATMKFKEAIDVPVSKGRLDVWWKCDLCGLHLNSEVSYRTHLKLKHKDVMERGNVWLHCGVCGKKFPNSKTIRRHMYRKHRKGRHSQLQSSIGRGSFLNTSDEALQDDMMISAISDEVFAGSPLKTPRKTSINDTGSFTSSTPLSLKLVQDLSGVKSHIDSFNRSKRSKFKQSGISTQSSSGQDFEDLSDLKGASRSLPFTSEEVGLIEKKQIEDFGCDKCGVCQESFDDFAAFNEHMIDKHKIKFGEMCMVPLERLHMQIVGSVTAVDVKQEETSSLDDQDRYDINALKSTNHHDINEPSMLLSHISDAEVKEEVDAETSETVASGKSVESLTDTSPDSTDSLVLLQSVSDTNAGVTPKSVGESPAFSPVLSSVVSLAGLSQQEEESCLRSGFLQDVTTVQTSQDGVEPVQHDADVEDTAAGSDYCVVRVDEVDGGGIRESCAHCGSLIKLTKPAASTESHISQEEKDPVPSPVSEEMPVSGALNDTEPVKEIQEKSKAEKAADVLEELVTSQKASSVAVIGATEVEHDLVSATSLSEEVDENRGKLIEPAQMSVAVSRVEGQQPDTSPVDAVGEPFDGQVESSYSSDEQDHEDNTALQNLTNTLHEDDEATCDSKKKKKHAKVIRPRAKQLPFICTHCTRVFRTAQHIRQHMMNKHSADVSKKAIECIIEDQQVYGNQNLSDQAQMVCPYCQRSRPGKAILKHLQVWHSDRDGIHDTTASITDKLKQMKIRNLNSTKNNKTKITSYKCEFCEDSFDSKAKLVVHKKYSCKENPKASLKCGKCEFVGDDYEDLKKHREDHYKTNDGVKFVCESCGAKYKHLSALVAHRVSKHHTEAETGSRRWECDLCKRLFNYKRVYLRHLVTHSDSREAVCDLCGKSYKTLEDLRVHKKRIHYHLYPYHCQSCGHGVQRQKSLRTHRCGQVRPRKAPPAEKGENKSGATVSRKTSSPKAKAKLPLRRKSSDTKRKIVRKKKMPGLPVAMFHMPVITPWDAGQSVDSVLAGEGSDSVNVISDSAASAGIPVNTTDLPVITQVDVPVITHGEMPVIAPVDMPVITPADMPVITQVNIPVITPEGAPSETGDPQAAAASVSTESVSHGDAVANSDGFLEMNEASNANELMIMYTRLQAGDLELLSS